MSGFRVLGQNDQVGYEKVERLKVAKGFTEYVKPLAVELKHPVDGAVSRGVFFENAYYSGKRSDGSNWLVSAHPDPAQNYAASALGAKLQTSFACVVLHLLRVDQRTSSSQVVMRCLVWTGGPDKWRKLQEFEKRHGSLDAHEIIAACDVTEDAEKYQKLSLSLVNPSEHLLPQILASDPTLQTSLAASYAEAVADLALLLKPLTYVEQQTLIAGRNAGQAGAYAQGFGPQAASMPPAGFGPPAAGLPAVTRPAFMGAAPVATQAAPVPFTPPVGLPAFGQTPVMQIAAAAPAVTAVTSTAAPPVVTVSVPASANPPASDAVSGSFEMLLKSFGKPAG